MIPAIISFLIGLILTFNEKVHLFRKPYTKSKIAIIILLVGGAAISFWQDQKDGEQRAADSMTISTLSIRDSVLSDQLDTLRKENKIAQTQYEDSLKTYHNYTTELLARYGLKVDTLSNTVKKFDTLSKRGIVSPVLQLNPVAGIKVVDSTDEKYKLRINIQSIDAGSTAYAVSIHYVFGIGDKLYYQSNHNPFPSGSSLAANETWDYGVTCRRPIDIIYLLLKGSYKNLDESKMYKVNTLYSFDFRTRTVNVPAGSRETKVRQLITESDHNRKTPES